MIYFQFQLITVSINFSCSHLSIKLYYFIQKKRSLFRLASVPVWDSSAIQKRVARIGAEASITTVITIATKTRRDFDLVIVTVLADSLRWNAAAGVSVWVRSWTGRFGADFQLSVFLNNRFHYWIQKNNRRRRIWIFKLQKKR